VLLLQPINLLLQILLLLLVRLYQAVELLDVLGPVFDLALEFEHHVLDLLHRSFE
jgi:hypothetical protein